MRNFSLLEHGLVIMGGGSESDYPGHMDGAWNQESDGAEYYWHHPNTTE